MKLPSIAMGIAMLAIPNAANAVLIDHGVSYTLESTTTANPLTERFALVITGENTASDTEGGRTGINAIAFTQPSNFLSASMILPATGYTFVSGGLNSSGCDGSGNFYCFDNVNIPPTPTTPLSGKLVFVFDVTLASGNFTGYAPDFKIDWVGSHANYDLVSKPIGVNPTCPDCVINPVISTPEPMSLAVLTIGLLGLGTIRYRRDM